MILGGQGSNTLQLQHSVKDFSFAHDGMGALYVRDAQGGISMTRDIGTLVSKEPGLFWGLFKEEVSHSVTANGLLAGNNLTAYASSVKGSAASDTLQARATGDWLFGQDGNDVLVGGVGNDTFVGGADNDVMQSGGGNDTFLFNGAFGQDRISGYDSGDKLVFLGVQGAGTGYDYSQHLSQVGNDTLLKVGDSSVTLVGVGLTQVGGEGFVFA